MQTRRALLAAVATTGFAGCLTDGGTPTEPNETSAAGKDALSAGTESWYTHPQATGNRTLGGRGDIRSVEPVEFSVDGRPQWLVAAAGDDGSIWTVMTDDGTVTHWRVDGDEVTQISGKESIPPETQPVVRTTGDGPELVQPPGDLASRSSPIIDPGSGTSPAKLRYVAENGDFVITGSEPTRLAVNALRDGRLAAVGDDRYALFADPTDRYRHGALGDGIEGETLVVVDASAAEIVSRTTLDSLLVFESLQPLVADLDGDGNPEIVTTIADSANGARIAVFTPEGDRLATGPIHEPGWRHQLAVAPFGPDGTPELAVVRKPHVEYVLEYYRLDDGTLDVVATASGVSSHTYGSRILDGAVAGDPDDDGATELLVPTANRFALAAIRRHEGGVRGVWQLQLDSAVRSNVTGVSLADGRLAVGVGTAAGVSVWQG